MCLPTCNVRPAAVFHIQTVFLERSLKLWLRNFSFKENWHQQESLKNFNILCIDDLFNNLAEAFDNELMYKTLKDIVEGRVVEVPTYDFVTHSRWDETFHVFSSWYFYLISSLCDLKTSACVFSGWTRGSRSTQRTSSSSRASWSSTRRKCATCFTWSSSWTRIQTSGCLAEVPTSPTYCNDNSTRCRSASISLTWFFSVVLRDMNRGRDLEQILTQYTTFVKPAFEEFCLPVSVIGSSSALQRSC